MKTWVHRSKVAGLFQRGGISTVEENPGGITGEAGKKSIHHQFSCSVVSDSATPWTTACQAYLSIINSQSLLKFMSIELVMSSNHLIFCHPLLLVPSIFPSISVFSNESVLCGTTPNPMNSMKRQKDKPRPCIKN